MTLVYLALGSNMGDRRANLAAACAMLEDEGVHVLRRSSPWETPPVPAGQPAFLNAALAAETGLEPHVLLRAAKRIEHALGRRPTRHWGPRPCDIDILFYGEQVIDTPDLQVPHPLVTGRAFVLVPLSEVAPGPLPVLGRSAAQLLAQLPPEPMRRVAGSLAPPSPGS